MAQENLDHLISRLHDLFGADDSSAMQERIMSELAHHRHPVDEAESPDPRPIDTLEAMLEEFEEEHPQVSAVLGQIVTALKNMGV